VIDIYSVGLLRDLHKFRGVWKHVPSERWSVARGLIRSFRTHWRQGSYWNGYLAEPPNHDGPSWTRCGHGWTRRRALADLAAHQARLRAQA
jgi:hypothetical protein